MKVLLKNIAIIAAGQGAPQGDENYCDNGVPFVKAGNLAELVEGKPITEIQKVSGEVAKKYRLRLYKKGSVLFAKSGMSCLKGYIYVLPQDAYVVSHLACVIPNEDISEYLKYYFEYNRPNKLIKDEAYPSISLTDIGELKIDIKTQGERENIVRNLDCIAYLIELQKKQLQMFNILIKSRFVEMFGDPVHNPMGWPVPLIEEVVSSEKNALKAGPFGSALKKEFYVKSGYKIYGQEQVINEDPMYGDYYIDEEKYKSLENCAVKAGDVLISLVGTYGKLLIIPEIFEPGIINPRLLKITFNQMKVNPIYFKYYFQSDSLKQILSKNTHGGTMNILNLGIVRNLQIPLPPIELQNKFAAFVHQVEKLKSEEQKELEKVQTLFDSLMQKYFG